VGGNPPGFTNGDLAGVGVTQISINQPQIPDLCWPCDASTVFADAQHVASAIALFSAKEVPPRRSFTISAFMY
jgi:hypothetical protein